MEIIMDQTLRFAFSTTITNLATARKSVIAFILAMFLFTAFSTPAEAEVRYDASHQEWTLQTGGVAYKLGQKDGGVYLKYFGPVGQPSWDQTAVRPTYGPTPVKYDIAGQAEGELLSPANLELVSHEILHPAAGADELELIYKHRRLPLQIAVQYFTWGDTGVLTRQLTMVNKGGKSIHVESLPSLALDLPGGNYDLTYLWGGWGRERGLATEQLAAGRKAFVSTHGRSTRSYAPWFCLHNKELGIRFLAELAYSGNWEMSFEKLADPRRIEEDNLELALGMRPDFGGPLGLSPGESFTLPAVAFTATAGDLDDGANQLHRYQRQFVVPRTPSNDPLLVQFNSWYPFPGKMLVDDMKRCADVAAKLGAEAFVLDAGWFSGTNWGRELGDWTSNPQEFPHGIEELAQYVRGKGMKFGIWVEIENLGINSKMFQQHPDWCLAYNGKPLIASDRYHLNFAKPEVRQWARSVIDRFEKDYGIEWLKIDYNTDIGERFDPPDSMERGGHVLHDHLINYYRWLDEVRAAYPKLVIENCSSGGTRFDLGIIAHTHTTWLSDRVLPLPSVQLGYGCTVEFIPEICNHWMVGDKENGQVSLSNPPGWWDFILRVPMTGQFGMSSRVFDWNDDLLKRAADNVTLYKRTRHVIMGADVYHLTPQPSHDDPTGWCAIQYVSADKKQSLVMAYRLGTSGAQQVFKLRGLDPARSYHVSRDGMGSEEVSGQVLSTSGLLVQLGDEWRAEVVEIQEQ
jgi:alpha-galactosidase